MKKKSFVVLICVLAVSFLLVYSFIKPAFRYLSHYLSKSEKVNANVLLVEGWIPESALEQAYNEFKTNKYDYLITTGLKSVSQYYKVSENGYLIFYPRKKFPGLSISGSHTIDVDAYSELDKPDRAHFNFFINDSLTADFYAEKTRKHYKVHYSGSLANIDSIMIQFTNDDKGEFGDRNLYVRRLIIDDTIKIPYQYSVYDVSRSGGRRRINNDFRSYAGYARNVIISMGNIDTSRVIATFGDRVRINRTLTSALAFRDWITKNNIPVTGINILSIGTHARRTWMTYNRILNEKYEIGIISIPESFESHGKERKVFKTIRETIGFLYYWFILIPY
jgi:hypothetical protein